MKHLLFTALHFCALAALSAQSPVYVLFNSNCMGQLEYKYTRSGETVFAYSVRPNAEEQYIFMSGSSGMTTDKLPDGTLNCNDLNPNDEVVRIINQQASSRQMYVIIQRPNDYLMMPIYSAVQIKRYGAWYLLVGPKYTFAIDTTRLSYQDNLQGESSPTVIRFAGNSLANCRQQWKFHGEPARGYTERMDFDFIYGIGIVNSRTGSTPAELQESEMKLIGVDGQYFENYLADVCRQVNQQTNNDYNTSNWTNSGQYTEPDKENNSASQANLYDYNNPSGNYRPSGNCSTPFGQGYHVVQPGESLKAIARTYKADLKAVIKWNNIKNPDHIEICQKIWLQKPPANASDAPAQYNYNSNKGTSGPTVASQWSKGNEDAPAQYNYNTAANSRTHAVQKGETLFGIAKKYKCAEECIRQANSYPLTGNVTIKAGETIVIPECTCQVGGNTGQTNAGGNYRSAPNTPPQISNVLNNQTQPQQPSQSPVVYNYQNPNPNNFAETPVNHNYQNPGSRTPAPNQSNTDPQDLPPTQEYIVRQGETINSVAIKHRMSVSELSNLNSIAMDEKLTPGKRLIVRRYTTQQ